MYSVLASPVDYRYSVCIFVSSDMNACISVASTCYQNSSLSCFKIVDDKDNTLVSYVRIGQ